MVYFRWEGRGLQVLPLDVDNLLLARIGYCFVGMGYGAGYFLKLNVLANRGVYLFAAARWLVLVLLSVCIAGGGIGVAKHAAQVLFHALSGAQQAYHNRYYYNNHKEQYE